MSKSRLTILFSKLPMKILFYRIFFFHKLYNQLGENDHDLRALYNATFDFSKKKNYCVAMKIGELLVCGEPCEDAFCYKNLLQIKELRMLPRPCKVCGVGVINHLLQQLYT